MAFERALRNGDDVDIGGTLGDEVKLQRVKNDEQVRSPGMETTPDEWIERQLASAPPITESQRRRIVRLLMAGNGDGV